MFKRAKKSFYCFADIQYDFSLEVVKIQKNIQKKVFILSKLYPESLKSEHDRWRYIQHPA